MLLFVLQFAAAEMMWRQLQLGQPKPRQQQQASQLPLLAQQMALAAAALAWLLQLLVKQRCQVQCLLAAPTPMRMRQLATGTSTSSCRQYPLGQSCLARDLPPSRWAGGQQHNCWHQQACEAASCGTLICSSRSRRLGCGRRRGQVWKVVCRAVRESSSCIPGAVVLLPLVQVTALGNPMLLERMSGALLEVRRLFREADTDGEHSWLEQRPPLQRGNEATPPRIRPHPPSSTC